MFKVKITKKPNPYIGRIFKYLDGGYNYRIENDSHSTQGNRSYAVTELDDNGEVIGIIGYYHTPKDSLEKDLKSGNVIWIK